MPARPPDTQFYENTENYTLWRDVSRLFEDWAPIDAPERTERFVTVLKDILSRLEPEQPEIALIGLTEEEVLEVVRTNAAVSSNG